MGTSAGDDLSAVPWALRLPRSGAASLDALRLVDGVRVHDAGEVLWLCGDRADAALLLQLAAVPGAERFVVDGDGRCRRPGRHLPIARLPRGPWGTLRERVGVELPVPALPAVSALRVPIGLVRYEYASIAPRDDARSWQPNVLRTDLATLARYVETAAAARLQPLCLAVHRDGSALVHGAPLLPLPGEVAIERDGIVVPVGYRLDPACPTGLVANLLALEPGDLACFLGTGGCTIVRAAAFVALTRSAVRLTLARSDNGG